MRKVIYFFVAASLMFGCDTMQSRYDKAVEINSIESYKGFLEKYPESEFVNKVEEAIIKLEFENAQKIDTIEAYNNYVNNYYNSPLKEEAQKRLCFLVFNDENINDLSELKRFYLENLECVYSDSIAKKAWNKIKITSFIKYPDFIIDFAGSHYTSIAEDFLNNIDFEILDDKTILFKKGFDYQKDISMGHSSNLIILKENNGVFETTGLSVIPYCNLSDESKESRNKPNNSFFSLISMESAIGMYWTFSDTIESVSIVLGQNWFEFIPKNNNAKISFKKEGVLVENMRIIPSVYYSK